MQSTVPYSNVGIMPFHKKILLALQWHLGYVVTNPKYLQSQSGLERFRKVAARVKILEFYIPTE